MTNHTSRAMDSVRRWVRDPFAYFCGAVLVYTSLAAGSQIKSDIMEYRAPQKVYRGNVVSKSRIPTFSPCGHMNYIIFETGEKTGPNDLGLFGVAILPPSIPLFTTQEECEFLDRQFQEINAGSPIEVTGNYEKSYDTSSIKKISVRAPPWRDSRPKIKIGEWK